MKKTAAERQKDSVSNHLIALVQWGLKCTGNSAEKIVSESLDKWLRLEYSNADILNEVVFSWGGFDPKFDELDIPSRGALNAMGYQVRGVA